MKRLAIALALSLAAALPAAAQGARKADPANTLLLETAHGRVTIALRPDLAPKHAERLTTLARRKFYDNVPFHRVIPGFMAQTGDPTGTGTGKSDLPDLPAEFSRESFQRGAVGMARSQLPNSANSQFFIVYGDASFLDGKYTYVGDVVSGMEVVDKIKKGSQAENGIVPNPDKMLSLRVAADAK